jgi:hypothetical protein
MQQKSEEYEKSKRFLFKSEMTLMNKFLNHKVKILFKKITVI